MRSFIQLLFNPEESLKDNHKLMSLILVVLTISMDAIFEPILGYMLEKDPIIISTMLMIFIIGIIAYIIDTAVIWGICRCFGSNTSFVICFQKWGLMFLPTLFCSILVALTEKYYYYFPGNNILIIICSFLFIGFLVWKVLLFIIFLNKTMNVQWPKLLFAFIILSIIILLLVLIYARLGLKAPII